MTENDQIKAAFYSTLTCQSTLDRYVKTEKKSKIYEEMVGLKKKKSVCALNEMTEDGSKQLVYTLLSLLEKITQSNDNHHLEFVSKLKGHLL